MLDCTHVGVCSYTFLNRQNHMLLTLALFSLLHQRFDELSRSVDSSQTGGMNLRILTK